MNIRESFGIVRKALFRTNLVLRRLLPRRSISAFGVGDDRIEAIIAINLDRQPARWRLLQQELDRFETHDRRSLTEITYRMSAIDARDGRETAPTVDVDPVYSMGDQLFVQPDPQLKDCFGQDEQIHMTRQEIAVARSHIEAWKRIARGQHEYTLVLEDDVYFVGGAATLIERGWDAAIHSRIFNARPQLLYLSYLDAGGTAERADASADLFRPIRGLWHLSGYVLSRSGAERLLKSMPVVGPVDLWINYRFAELDVLALPQSAILQRPDGGSDNAYSILPYLARSGMVDVEVGNAHAFTKSRGIVFAWNVPGSTDSMGMALSTLGYRVRTFASDSTKFDLNVTLEYGGTFDAYVDAKLDEKIVSEIIQWRPDTKFIIATSSHNYDLTKKKEDDVIRRGLPLDRTAIVPVMSVGANRWGPLCNLLELPLPDYPFPQGAAYKVGLFQVDNTLQERNVRVSPVQMFDESPWVLTRSALWRPQRPLPNSKAGIATAEPILRVDLSSPPSAFRASTETFPGNMAAFQPNGIRYGADGATFVLQKSAETIRPLSSGAFASINHFIYGRFEAEIRSAKGAGLVTGFFLHRDHPKQEIDIELLGSNSNSMLVNVYFNPGDEGTTMAYGYRGTPYIIDLGFDASADFHTYAIEWSPAWIRWIVDGQVLHQRSTWDPTPIPHLPMRLHANLWSPRSVELAGKLQNGSLPAHSTFKRISIYNMESGQNFASTQSHLYFDHENDLESAADLS